MLEELRRNNGGVRMVRQILIRTEPGVREPYDCV
jgi:hypothetical protein